MQTLTTPPIEAVRARFPSMAEGFAFMDNAGGSQVPADVADAIRHYMLTSYVQVGADYPASARATQNVAAAHSFVETLMGGHDEGRAILGSSTSSLLRMLADCYANALSPGDEIVIAESGHEANISPWLSLRERGFVVRMWEASPETGVCTLDKLTTLLSSKTRVVALPHVSNILGCVEDVGPCIAAAKAAGARVVLDGVAYAPHLPMEVASLGVDWYVFSCYKVLGPHLAALWGRHEAQAELTGPGHSIVPRTSVPYKFELGGVSHEACAGLNAIANYFCFLSERNVFDRATAVAAMAASDALEQPLTAKTLAYLKSKAKVRVYGRATPGVGRLPIISFTHATTGTREIADAVALHKIGMRWGSFYSYRLIERLGLDVASGVARVSFAHYNSSEEVDRLITALDPLLN